MPFDADKFKQELDSLGYEIVREKLATDETWYNYEPRSRIAQNWVRSIEDERRDFISSSTRRIAICANIIAIVAALAAIAAAIITYIMYSAAVT